MIRRCGFLHLEKTSTCQGYRYSAATVGEGMVKLLVRKTKLADVGRVIADAAQGVGIEAGAFRSGEHYGLVAANAGYRIDGVRVSAKLQVALAADGKEAETLMKPVEALEIDIGTIHDHECPGLAREQIEHTDVVHFAVRDMDNKGRSILSGGRFPVL